MKRKILHTAIVAIVMGTAIPVQAAPYQVMYTYYHYENGELVGQGNDRCTNSGVVTQGQWLWGYGTSDIVSSEWIGCENGQWVPLQ